MHERRMTRNETGHRHLRFLNTDLRMYVNFDVFLWKEGTLKFPCTMLHQYRAWRDTIFHFLSRYCERILSHKLLIMGYFEPAVYNIGYSLGYFSTNSLNYTTDINLCMAANKCQESRDWPQL